ncbi:conjugal transfer protein TraJ [Acetobacteraceae bacterium]|nr:conjugal transfer protein TraJ [Acetobacteraceae bacterium]
MNDISQTKSRRHFTPIKVYVLPEEKAEISENAKKAHYTDSSYLRLLGMNYLLKAPVDLERVKDLVGLKGDFNRMGGLLRLWLTKKDDQRKITAQHLQALLSKIEESSEEISLMLKEIRRKHTKPRKSKRYE